MKKTIAITTAIFSAAITNAQTPTYQPYDYNMYFNTGAAIFVLLAVMVFILAFFKRLLEYRLKNKIVDRGIPESLVSSLLQTDPREAKHANVKWFAILASCGLGLAIVNYTQPLGIHSLAILAFCIAFGFLGYFFYLKNAAD